MAWGPGKYDDVTTEVRNQLSAEGVLLIVVKGRLGSGFSAQLSPVLLMTLPEILRDIAKQIEESGPNA